jgi:CheY-like chemotaxis protein
LIEAERLVPDLIVLEITIPELIGIEAARQLLKKSLAMLQAL